MSLTAESVKEGPLQLHDASFEKHGDALAGAGVDLARGREAALGEGVEVRLLGSHGGQVK